MLKCTSKLGYFSRRHNVPVSVFFRFSVVDSFGVKYVVGSQFQLKFPARIIFCILSIYRRAKITCIKLVARETTGLKAMAKSICYASESRILNVNCFLNFIAFNILPNQNQAKTKPSLIQRTHFLVKTFSILLPICSQHENTLQNTF